MLQAKCVLLHLVQPCSILDAFKRPNSRRCSYTLVILLPKGDRRSVLALSLEWSGCMFCAPIELSGDHAWCVQDKLNLAEGVVAATNGDFLSLAPTLSPSGKVNSLL
jgi:hypothetical protein